MLQYLFDPALFRVTDHLDGTLTVVSAISPEPSSKPGDTWVLDDPLKVDKQPSTFLIQSAWSSTYLSCTFAWSWVHVVEGLRAVSCL